MFFFLYLFSLVYSAVITYNCGDSVFCDFDKDSKSFVVRGTGDMKDFEPDPDSMEHFFIRKLVLSIEVEEGVTSIGNNAFFDFEKVASVSLPKGLKRIGSYSFESCLSLKEVTIPKTVTEIDERAFYLSFSEEEGGKVIFEKNSQLSELKLGLFEESNIVSVEIPASVEIINTAVFDLCKMLKTVKFESNSKLETIKKNAFFKCSNLVEMEFPSSLQTIEDEAFFDSGVTSVRIPKSLKTLGYRVFGSCKNLEKFTVEQGNSLFSVDEEGLLYKKIDNYHSLIHYPSGKKDTRIVIPSYGKTISSYAFDTVVYLEQIHCGQMEILEEKAFYDCMKLNVFITGEYLTTIKKGSFEKCDELKRVNIGKKVSVLKRNSFGLAKGIESFDVHMSNQYFSSMNDILYTKNKKTLLRFPPQKEVETPYYVDSNIEVIYDNAFSGQQYLKELIIDGGVNSIRSNAFQGCTQLTDVTITSSVKSIGSHVFDGCTELKSVKLGNNVKMIGSGAFKGLTNLTSLTIGSGILSFESEAFSMENLEKSSPIETLRIPDSTLYINEKTFYGLKDLKSVIIGSSIVEIGLEAFADCDNLEELTIKNDDMTRIDEEAFRNTKIKSLTIPKNIKFVGDYSFKSTHYLEELKYYGTQQPIYCASNAFDDSSMKSIQVSKDYEQDQFCGLSVEKVL